MFQLNLLLLELDCTVHFLLFTYWFSMISMTNLRVTTKIPIYMCPPILQSHPISATYLCTILFYNPILQIIMRFAGWLMEIQFHQQHLLLSHPQQLYAAVRMMISFAAYYIIHSF